MANRSVSEAEPNRRNRPDEIQFLGDEVNARAAFRARRSETFSARNKTHRRKADPGEEGHRRGVQYLTQGKTVQRLPARCPTSYQNTRATRQGGCI